MLMQSKKSVE